MEAEVMARARSADAVVMAAAVADFRPKAAADGKLRKDEGVPDIVLEPTTDILAALGRAKPPGQVLVGFAAETGADDLRERAFAKLRAKHLDAIVANDVTVPGAGFWHDTNAAVIIEADGSEQDIPLTSKSALASVVLDLVARRLAANDGRTTP
jgi:phosphopantothenoylcysteine decarboxylase/phosphopantothenate--cysteine ligase